MRAKGIDRVRASSWLTAGLHITAVVCVLLLASSLPGALLAAGAQQFGFA